MIFQQQLESNEILEEHRISITIGKISNKEVINNINNNLEFINYQTNTSSDTNNTHLSNTFQTNNEWFKNYTKNHMDD